MARDDSGNALNHVHRRRFLLSGLLTCGLCGGLYSIIGKDRYGCSTRRSKGTCNNTRTIKRQAIEARVLDGLKARLVAPELVELFVSTFHDVDPQVQRCSCGQRITGHMLVKRLGGRSLQPSTRHGCRVSNESGPVC